MGKNASGPTNRLHSFGHVRAIPGMGKTLAIMVTTTTYGTWLRGDRRGWVDDGRVLPPDPELEAVDAQRLKHPAYRFSEDQLLPIGRMIGDALVKRKSQHVLALTVAAWHVHLVVGATSTPIGEVVKCAKDAVRYGLRPGRPIWTTHYDKRFCFDESSVANRVRYVERHNEERGWPAKPWPFLVGFDA